MNIKKIDVDLSTQSIDNAIKQITRIRGFIKMMNEDFIIESLKWIQEQAKLYHTQRNYKYPNTANINNNWSINKVYKNKNEMCYELKNDNDLVAYVEFGTGVAGQLNPHASSKEVGYEYDKNAHGLNGWTFYNEELSIYFRDFIGYEGQSFLYDAMWDYFYKNEWKRIYKRIYNKYMN